MSDSTTKNRDLFVKDPLSWTIANEGVSSNNVEDVDTLRYELTTFVCEGEYRTGLVKIVQGYLDNLGKEQKAAWVSGFYGSGKSHLVKVLRYLWTDFPLPGGHSARTLASLPEDIRDLLKELSTRGKQGAGLHSAGGTMKAGVGSVRLRLLGIVLASVGLPPKPSRARLIMDLRDDGRLEDMRGLVASAGKELMGELGRIYTSKALHEAYLACYPHHGSAAAVAQALRAEYPDKVDDISIADMLATARRALERGHPARDSRPGRPGSLLPCTVIVLDEIQQFIANNADLAHDVQEVVEALSKEMDGQILVVGTGQSALTDTPALQRLMGRFTTKVHLKDNDVERVVRTVVLQKKEDAKPAIADLVSRRSGEIARQLKSTRIATCADDDQGYVPDYPLLPVRRRFWERVLQSCDPSGTAAQMRTQLRVTHEACRLVAEQPLGAVIPADFIYDQLASELVTTGELQKRFQEIIDEQRRHPDGPLRSRLCAMVFLIDKLPREGVDSGVRANPEHLSDLLTDDLGDSATSLRAQVPAYNYLGDWIRQQEADAKADKPGAARALEQELIAILEGEPPYDLFIRWKPLAEQPLGWQPDINDGVRLNIRPFMQARDLGKKGAGILRAKPNIKWDKDRGTEPLRDKSDYPWFWHAEEPPLACPGGPNRWNLVHLTLARKRAARKNGD